MVVEEEDDALATTQNQNSLLDVRQYIVYSATFQVPTFYFTMHTTSMLFNYWCVPYLYISGFTRWFSSSPRGYPQLTVAESECIA